jgi:hypothetical protein
MKSPKARTFRLIIALVIWNTASLPLFAAEKCKINNGPPPEVSAYITKLNTSISALTNAANSASCNVTGAAATDTTSQNLSEANAAIVRGVNVSLTQDSYLDSAAFTTELSLKSEVPPALRQHLNLLLKSQDAISRAIESVYRKCGQSVEVEGNTVIEGLGKEKVQLGKLGEFLLTNHIDVLSVYRTSVLGRPAIKEGLLLVPADFPDKIYASYGPDAQQDCRKEADVYKKIRDSIAKLSQTAGNIAKGMAIWQQSDLKTESAHEEATRQKRDKEYAPKLKKTGLYSDISAAEERNQTNYTTPDKDTGISGFLQNVGARTVSTFNRVKEFYTFTPKVEDAKTTVDWIARYDNINTLQIDVDKEIVEKYTNLMSQVGDAQLSKDIYEGKLGRIYIELETGKKFLDPYRKVAQKICQKDQAQNVDSSGCVPGN